MVTLAVGSRFPSRAEHTSTYAVVSTMALVVREPPAPVHESPLVPPTSHALTFVALQLIIDVSPEKTSVGRA